MISYGINFIYGGYEDLHEAIEKQGVGGRGFIFLYTLNHERSAFPLKRVLRRFSHRLWDFALSASVGRDMHENY